MILKVIFWICIFIILYTYIGYTLLLFISAGIYRLFAGRKPQGGNHYEPDVCIMIPAYNEADCVAEKVRNTYELDYPKGKLKIIWVTDGSTDNTVNLLSQYKGITIVNNKERKGKAQAINHGIKETDAPVVVFTDANTHISHAAIKEMVKLFADEKTGCVTGEKRISMAGKQRAVGAGEGLYWQYESLIKRLESKTGSVMGAVGELFAIRRELFDELSHDTLLDDFTISLQIACKGYHIKYSPLAWSTETSSASIHEEIKRKIRIAVGGLQSLSRMVRLLNPLRYGILTWKYISHKALRWTVVPFAFPLAFLTNLIMVVEPEKQPLYIWIFFLQIVFYVFVMAGAVFQHKKIGFKAIFTPYYLFIMNYAVVRGLFQFVTGRYSVNWQKARREV
jgi:cellulose synthase/poly-beta-1,6-N-acetylglucosamine synthase-like glycosyltransferase